ncbi:MAG: sulfite exporter TauE/SafE family protein [Bacillota bacterium]|nr:sulfite exporter TauE/SafE family protein [Bacillota bacterium]
MAAQMAQAKWEIETSRVILTRRRKWLLIALAPLIIALGVQLGFAALPDAIGGSKAYMPQFVNTSAFLMSLFIGLCAGLITGCIGAGGGFILTPALMSAGVRGIMAVGTDQFHIFAKAIMGTVLHSKLGNVNVGLAFWFVVGSFTGVTFGGKLNRAIYESSPAMSDAFINSVYVLMLGFLGVYALYDYLRLKSADKTGADVSTTTGFAQALQKLNVPPTIKFDQGVVPGGRRIPIYPVIVCGFVVGFVAAIMGVGGGFLTFPMFVYGLGVSTFTTVGTDILQIIFTTAYASIFQYAIYGFVFYTLAMGLLLGSLVGIQMGSMVTSVVKGSVIKGFYATVILAGFVNRACALPAKLSSLGYIRMADATGKILDTIGVVLFFALVGGFAVWVMYEFFKNLPKFRAAHQAYVETHPAAEVGH